LPAPGRTAAADCPLWLWHCRSRHVASSGRPKARPSRWPHLPRNYATRSTRENTSRSVILLLLEPSNRYELPPPEEVKRRPRRWRANLPPGSVGPARGCRRSGGSLSGGVAYRSSLLVRTLTEHSGAYFMSRSTPGLSSFAARHRAQGERSLDAPVARYAVGTCADDRSQRRT